MPCAAIRSCFGPADSWFIKEPGGSSCRGELRLKGKTYASFAVCCIVPACAGRFLGTHEKSYLPGTTMQTPLTFFFAFVVVLALIGLAAWLVRRFAGNLLGANANRGRMPRLAVIDAAAVDHRRRLVLVRRDNIEHLLMIGGPTDIVVEQNIVRAMPARDQVPSRPGVGGAELTRAPLPDAGSWSDGEAGDQPEPAT